jgi:hypothetical protein
MSDAVEVLRSVWSTDPEDGTEQAVVEDCGPQRTCRNMKHVSFDGLAEPGSDLAAAWRERLAREGKLGASSLGDLIRGQQR